MYEKEFAINAGYIPSDLPNISQLGSDRVMFL